MVALFFHYALIRPSRITLRPPACSMIKTLFIQNSSLCSIHKKHTSKACRYFEACRPAGSLIKGDRRRQKAIGCLPPTWNFLKAYKRVHDSSDAWNISTSRKASILLNCECQSRATRVAPIHLISSGRSCWTRARCVFINSFFLHETVKKKIK